MHRAGVDRPFRDRRLRTAFVEITIGIGRELGAATGRAEVIGFSVMVEVMLTDGWVYAHAANRIDCGIGPRLAMMMIMLVRMVVVVMTPTAARSGWLGLSDRRFAPTASTPLGPGADICILSCSHLILRHPLVTHTL
jgi:hypothetical protein